METKLYVGNLSYDSTQQDIQALFETYGTVNDVFIVKDRESGRPRGFAFVTMDNDESMKAAIEGLNGQEFMGRELAINEARPREERGGGGGRGGDHRGGGGRGGDHRGGGGGRGGDHRGGGGGRGGDHRGGRGGY